MASVNATFSTTPLLLQEHRAVLDLHGIGAYVFRAGRADRLARRNMELALVQRAFDLFALDEAVGQARLAVRAGIVRGEDLPCDVVEAHGLGAERDEQGSVLGNIGGGSDFDPGFGHVYKG